MSSPENINIDPTVDQSLDEAVQRITEGAVDLKHFGDSVIVELPDLQTIRPGETAVEAHLRIQKEHNKS